MGSNRFGNIYKIWMGIFIVIPLFIIIYFAFTTTGGSLTIDNILDSGKYAPAFLQSVWLGIISTIICVVIGYPLGYIIAMSAANRQRTLVLLIMLPMWMNFLLRTYAWMTLLENNGIINNLLSFVGLPRLSMINTSGAVVLGMVYNFLPFMVMPIYSILSKLDKSVLESAEDLGANKFQIFKRIVLPLSLPGVISGITMVFVPAVSTFVISRMLGGGDMLIGDVIESQFFGATYNPNLGAALALILMVIVLICMSIMNEFGDNNDEGTVLL